MPGSNDDLAPIDLADVLGLDAAVARTTDAAGFGLTDGGFVPKPYARIVTEKLALARATLGADVDLTPGSVIRKLVELSALEDARTWAALARVYDDQFVATACGTALSRLGDELGVPRPFLEATGSVALTYQPLPGRDALTIPRGARLVTSGGHQAVTLAPAPLTRAQPRRVVPVASFYPGPASNLDPARADPDGSHPMRLERWNPDDRKLDWDGDAAGLLKLAADNHRAPEAVVAIAHTTPLTGGELGWPDARYRALLLRAPRTLWSAEGIRLAASLVPGVRRVQVLDEVGGLDVDLPLFGQFRFAEALFAQGRDLLSPHHVDVLVAPSPSAITGDGPGNVAGDVAAALEGLRPVGVGVRVRTADQVFVSIAATITVDGIPIPRSPGAQLTSTVANELKQRLLARVADHVEQLGFGEPVRYAEVMWALMNEPGVADVTDLALLRFPPLNPQAVTPATAPYQQMPTGESIPIARTQIALAVNDDTRLSFG